MNLHDIGQKAGLSIVGKTEMPVTGFAIDHRKVAPGTVFGAFLGSNFNGEDFIPAAIKAGAIAVVARPKAHVVGAIHIATGEPRQTFAHLAAAFFSPVPKNLMAVTGTNGKTSCVEMTRQIWHICGERSASIGTLGVTTSDESLSTGLTTPDIVTFLSNLNGLAREGVSHVAFEASSHGLDQFRSDGLPLAAAAFTNFSRDHLDYHGSIDAYFEAKMRLFEQVLEPSSSAIFWRANPDDKWINTAIQRSEACSLKVLTVGPEGNFIKLLSTEFSHMGQILKIEHNGIKKIITLPLMGTYQGSNALIACSLAIVSGLDPDKVFDAASRIQPVKGRLERAVVTGRGAAIYVDYAHTPAAVEEVLTALRPHVAGKLITVLGAGGDRDKGKRFSMGEAALKGSDIVIVTDDNPRGENPSAIRASVLEGARGAIEIGDRRDAIKKAVLLSGDKDIIVIAGKGHEQGQIIGSGDNMQILEFDDVEVARECAAMGAQL